MNAREILAGAPYGPEAHQTLSRAFDDAWRSIGAYFGDDHFEIEAVRTKLAVALVSAASSHASDAEALKNAALQAQGWLPNRKN
jgi:hypothetical protein